MDKAIYTAGTIDAHSLALMRDGSHVNDDLHA